MTDKMGRKERRKSMIAVGTCTNLGPIVAVRKRTKKFGRHYCVGGSATREWMRRDHFSVVPCRD